ncbi:MAG: 7-cyano-7-deazaguanine synthase [Phycisphaerales bacterium]|nr:7-cyano-7-deazaguanine synthase [Phycisphaerales bacterium]
MGKRCVVVCSGGMDSTAAAAHARYIDGLSLVLLHFRYGCRAESREVEAIKAITSVLEGECVFQDLAWLNQLGNSRLTDHNAPIAGPVEGAEYPHEWVPARNLVMIAYAAAFCDAHGIDKIYMGLNMEESSVYPDNTVEFYERLNSVLPLATLIRPVIVMPLARMMKWQIVKHAHKINAPIHLSWSCYRSGTVHCGCCGPCYMRRTAHLMAGIPDTVEYAEGQ